MMTPIWRCFLFLCLAAAQLLAVDQPQPDPWTVSFRRAIELNSRRQFPESVEAGKQALSEAVKVDPNGHRVAASHYMLATIYRDWLHCSEARTHYARAAAIWKKQSGDFSRVVFMALVSLIGEATECDDPGAAESLYRQHLDELRRYASGPADDARLLGLQANFSFSHGRYADAETDFRQALQKLEETPHPRLKDVAGIHNALAVALNHQGRTEEGLAEAHRAIALLEASDARTPELAAALNSTASALFLLGRKEESQQVFERALELARELYGDDNRVTAKIMLNYSAVLRANKQKVAAQSMKQKAQQTYHTSQVRGAQSIDVGELGK